MLVTYREQLGCQDGRHQKPQEQEPSDSQIRHILVLLIRPPVSDSLPQLPQGHTHQWWTAPHRAKDGVQDLLQVVGEGEDGKLHHLLGGSQTGATSPSFVNLFDLLCVQLTHLVLGVDPVNRVLQGFVEVREGHHLHELVQSLGG